MKIRQTYLSKPDAIVNIDHESLDIVASDGRDLFTIKLNENGGIEITASSIVRHSGEIFDTALSVRPKFSNTVLIERVRHISE